MAAKKKLFLSSDKIFGLTAMLISFVTLIIFVRQTNIMDDQSRRSVMPYVNIELSDKGTDHQLLLDLVNHGVGPAIIDDISITYKGEKHDMDFYDFFMKAIPRADTLEFLNHSTIYKGLAIPASGRINALTVGATNAEYQMFKSEFEQIRNDRSFDFEIKYKSIYDDYWTINPKTGTPIPLKK